MWMQDIILWGCETDNAKVDERESFAVATSIYLKCCQKYKRPFLHIDFNALSEYEAVKTAEKWLNKVSPAILNVAGSRESTSKGIYEKVYRVLKKILPVSGLHEK